jgi:hypothetical protein
MDDFRNDDVAEVADGLERDNLRLEIEEGRKAINEHHRAMTAITEAARKTPEYERLFKAYYVVVNRVYRAEKQAKALGVTL